MKRLWVLFICIISVYICTCGWLYSQDDPAVKPADQAPAYTISVKGSPYQGGILFVTLPGTTGSLQGECTWRGKKYSFVAQHDRLGVLLPVALDTPPGAYTLTVAVKSDDSPDCVTQERIIPVKAHNYGVQHLWLSQEQLSRYDNPQADKDNDDIHEALSNYTAGISWDRPFIWPVPGYTSTQFGLKRFYNDDKEPEYHRGIDLSAGTGTPVKASQRGVVRFAKKNLLLHGTTVVLDHGKGIGTLYIHMNSVNVKTGDSLEQGDIVGTVGSTGVATGPHLHWAAYVHDEPVDPRLLFTLPGEWLDEQSR